MVVIMTMPKRTIMGTTMMIRMTMMVNDDVTNVKLQATARLKV